MAPSIFDAESAEVVMRKRRSNHICNSTKLESNIVHKEEANTSSLSKSQKTEQVVLQST